ncbi:MAG: pssA [Gemmatimonadetes bacterium]|nr:pssA [Gemmatimonadota bacterium]
MRRPDVRRAVVMLPNGATLLNLFFGIFSIVMASRGQYATAALFTVLGGVADALDGRIARATGTGSRFGEELDSLVDAISFGLAPALLMYFAVLSHDGWEWLFVFIFTSCAVVRLARFNVEQAGSKKTHFHGLPSPAAGMTLATYYWFAQTPLYNQAIIFFTDSKTLSDLPWHVMLKWLMVILAYLMVSDVPYPAVPTVGVRSFRQMMGTLMVAGSVLGLIFLPRQFVFPALLAYVLLNVIRAAVMGLVERGKDEEEPPSIFLEEEDDDGMLVPSPAPMRSTPRRERFESRAERPTIESGGLSPEGDANAQRKRRRRRRPPRTDRPGTTTPDESPDE